MITKKRIDVISVRASSSLAGLPNIHTDKKIELKFASPSVLSQRTVEGNLNKVESNFEPSKNHDIMETNGMDIDQVEMQQPKDARHGSSKPKLDEFGRLVRGGGVSNSDSDDMQYNDKHGNRHGSSGHWSPQEGRHRWNRSPRQRGTKNNSPCHASDLETDHSARKKERQKFDKLQQEEKEEICTKLAKLNSSTAKYMVSPSSVRENGLSREVQDDVKQEDTNQHLIEVFNWAHNMRENCLKHLIIVMEMEKKYYLNLTVLSWRRPSHFSLHLLFYSRSLIIIFWDKMNKFHNKDPQINHMKNRLLQTKSQMNFCIRKMFKLPSPLL